MKIKLFDQTPEMNRATARPLWEKEISKEEYRLLKQITDPRQTNTSPWAQILTPARTYPLTHLALDLFSPIIANSICYMNPQPPLSFAIIPMALLELLTFPSRVVTLPFRALYNSTRPEHPFRQWLYNEGVPQELYSAGSVDVCLEGDPKMGQWGPVEKPRLIKNERSVTVNFRSSHMLFNVSIPQKHRAMADMPSLPEQSQPIIGT